MIFFPGFYIFRFLFAPTFLQITWSADWFSIVFLAVSFYIDLLVIVLFHHNTKLQSSGVDALPKWSTAILPPFMFLKSSIYNIIFLNIFSTRAPEWLSQLSIRLRLRSWPHGLWVWTPHWSLRWQLRARFGFCLSLSLPLPCLCFVSISLKNK